MTEIWDVNIFNIEHQISKLFNYTFKNNFCRYGLVGFFLLYCCTFRYAYAIQYNLNGLNPDDSFTMDDSNSFFSPYKILPIAQENKYLGFFSYLIIELYVVCTH